MLLMQQPHSRSPRTLQWARLMQQATNSEGPTLLCSRPVSRDPPVKESLSSCSTSVGGDSPRAHSTSVGGDSPRAQILLLHCEEPCSPTPSAKQGEGSPSKKVSFRRLSRGGVETLEIPNLEMLKALGFVHHYIEDDSMPDDDSMSEDEAEDRLQTQKCTRVLEAMIQFVQQVFNSIRLPPRRV